MMKKILAIPAAGKGSRLNNEVPKIFVPICEGKTIFDFIMESMDPSFDEVILLLSPAGKQYFEKYVNIKAFPKIHVLVQSLASGMFDAVSQLVTYVLEIPEDVYLILQWGDQPFCDAKLHQTLLLDLIQYDAVIPLVWVENPYVQYKFSDQKIQVFEQREGETVDAFGLKDMGIFGFRKCVFQASWSQYAAEASVGKATGEKNFVKYISTLHPNFRVYLRLDQPYYKSIGINTPAELAEATLFVKQRQMIAKLT